MIQKKGKVPHSKNVGEKKKTRRNSEKKEGGVSARGGEGKKKSSFQTRLGEIRWYSAEEKIDEEGTSHRPVVSLKQGFRPQIRF